MSYYIIFSIVTYLLIVIRMNSIVNKIKAEAEINETDVRIHELFLSWVNIKLLVSCFMPIFNVLLFLMIMFAKDETFGIKWDEIKEKLKNGEIEK